MMRWEKVETQIGENGGKTITYRAEGCACQIMSIKRAIPHANGSGYWYYTDYVVLYPDNVMRVFHRLRDAQADAESYPRED